MSDRIAPNDPVEAEMGSGEVLRREKVVARSLALICLLMFVGFGAASIAYLRGWQADKQVWVHWLTYLLVPFAAWTGLTKTVLRTVVTKREVHAQQGFRGVRIPVASISRARVFTRGDRLEKGTELFFPAGGNGVVVDWRDERGRARRALIGSDDPPALLASVERAREVVAGNVRIASTPTRDENDGVPAETETETSSTRDAQKLP